MMENRPQTKIPDHAGNQDLFTEESKLEYKLEIILGEKNNGQVQLITCCDQFEVNKLMSIYQNRRHEFSISPTKSSFSFWIQPLNFPEKSEQNLDSQS